MAFPLKCFKWVFLTLGLVSLQVSAKNNRTCPFQEVILPCRCLERFNEIQIWCSHSNLPKTLEALQTVGRYLKGPIDELILENNNLPSLPGKAFSSLKVMRLMFRHNGLERVSNTWLNGLEEVLMELFIVEPTLRSLPDDSLSQLNRLEAITIQTNHLKRVPDFSGLQRLRYIMIQSPSLVELTPTHFRSLPALEKFHVTESPRLSRLENGLLEALPRLALVNISYCGVSWIHPRAISHLPSLTDLFLVGNKIKEAAMVGRSIKDLFALENLYLDYNYIEKLGEASFVDLPSLKSLHISNNKITELHHGAFHKVPKLRFVDLSRNLVRQVHPESFLQHSGSGLEELWLVQNDIAHVAELRSILDALPRLTFLDLSYNNLDSITFGALRGHPTLERLHLDHNRLRIIDREAFMAMPALTELRLRNNSLSDILDGPLWNLPGLKGLDLSENYIQRLEPRFLNNLPSLRRLDLSGNGLTIIDPEAFLETPALEHVNLSHNEISSLHPATFEHLENLYELDMHFNRLKDIVPGLPRTLEYLYLSDNQIDQIPFPPSADLNLPALKTLDLSMNRIEEIPPRSLQYLTQLKRLLMGKNELKRLKTGTFHGLTKLELLDLHKNRISTIDFDTFVETFELRELNLRENYLDSLKFQLTKSMTNLRLLDISKNNIKEILPEAFDNTRNLEIFNASHNLLTDLPASMFGLKYLQKLDLSHNRLRIISPDVLKTLDSLSELHLSHNIIEKLTSGSFENLPFLEILNLDNNNLETVQPKALLSLPKLKVLNLSRNKLQILPNRCFSNLPLLQVAELQENHLQKIYDSAFHLVPNLLLLNVSANFLTSLEDAGLASLKSLEMLDLSYNRLVKISPSSLERLEWLVELKLDNNKICAIHGSPFSAMYRLKVLSMRNNKLLSFPENAVKKLRGNLAIIDLNGNPLVCSCNLLWLKIWVEESFQKGPICGDGAMLREIRLSHQDCRKEDNKMEPIAPGCEADIDSKLLSTSQVFSQRNDKTNTAGGDSNNLAPLPQESEYFYDEYVDYPFNETALESTFLENSGYKSQLLKSSHLVPGDTPTIYANSSKNKSKSHLSDIPRNVSHSPGSSGFTFFGLPLGNFGLNKLWVPKGRMSISPKIDEEFEKKKSSILRNAGTDFRMPNVQEGGFIPIIPGTGGFTPIPGPSMKPIEQDDSKSATENPSPVGNIKRSGMISITEVRKTTEEKINIETSTNDNQVPVTTVATTIVKSEERHVKGNLEPKPPTAINNNKKINHEGINMEDVMIPKGFGNVTKSFNTFPSTKSIMSNIGDKPTQITDNLLKTVTTPSGLPSLTSGFLTPGKQRKEKDISKDISLIENIIEKTEALKNATSQKLLTPPPPLLMSKDVLQQFHHPGKITRVHSPHMSAPLHSERDSAKGSVFPESIRNKNRQGDIITSTEAINEASKDDWYFANYNTSSEKPPDGYSSGSYSTSIQSFYELIWERKLILVILAVVYNHVMY